MNVQIDFYAKKGGYFRLFIDLFQYSKVLKEQDCFYFLEELIK